MVHRSDQEFDEFATAAWPRLRRIGFLVTGDPHLGEELAQAALVRTYASWRRVRRDDASAYARRVLINLNIDRLRRSRRMTELDDDAVARLAVASGEGTADERDRIVRLLAGLTDRERRVVVLRHYCDLSEADVAHELGIAPGTVKSTLARALRKLRVSIDNGTDAAREVV
jgi:RNA polymerase sigma-70 factor (sigma-E family)